jgi:hypothetical protein
MSALTEQQEEITRQWGSIAESANSRLCAHIGVLSGRVAHLEAVVDLLQRENAILREAAKARDDTSKETEDE